jgi:hypothetical protein
MYAPEAQTARMSSSSWIFNPSAVSTAAPGELLSDYRSRLALEQSQAAERRQGELAEQSSALNAPGVRIRAWEKTHGLRLPRDSAHPVLRVVASSTHLTLEQVQEEQRLRSAHPSIAKPPADIAAGAGPSPT